MDVERLGPPLTSMQAMYIFGYGSLLSGASAGATLGYELDPEHGPFPATLAGWRAGWNAGSDTGSHPEREFRDEHGRVFDGVVAVLGVAPEPGARCPGAVFAVDPAALPRLDRRERNYVRQDITDLVRWSQKPHGCVVFTYVPRPEALRRLVEASEAGRQVVVRSSYLGLVRAACGQLSNRWGPYAEPGVSPAGLGSILTPPFPTLHLTQHVRLTRHAAVSP